MRKKPKIRVKSIVVAIGILLVIIAVPGIYLKAVSKSKSEIITTSTLEKIINVNDLSTYESIYNGVTQVMNEKKPDKVDYYVSYKAKVKAGIDFKKITINVDISSLDYIFENKKSETATVSEEAYKKCKEDVKIKVNKEDAIYDYAAENAKKEVVPQVSQMKSICELATIDRYYHNVAKYSEDDATGVLWLKVLQR